MSEKILIIDDEKNIRMMLLKSLQSEGYEVDSAEDGPDGIEKFEKENYSTVILDMKMPGLSGMDVLTHISGLNRNIPVIMMTAFGTIESAVEAMKLGAVDYIRKPFTPDVIREEVRNVLNRRKVSPQCTDDINSCLQYAKKCINSKEFKSAREYLMKGLSYGTDKPEVYNLLGVLSEFEGDVHEAQKFYRMALCIDYSYEPANRNLERTARFIYTTKGILLDDDKESQIL